MFSGSVKIRRKCGRMKTTSKSRVFSFDISWFYAWTVQYIKNVAKANRLIFP